MKDERLHLLVGVVFRDSAPTLCGAVDSILGQVGDTFRVTLLLVDDSSSDDWRRALDERLDDPRVQTRRVEFRSAARARNFVLDEAGRSEREVDYVCRLDADDLLAAPTVLGDLTAILMRERPDVLVAGNLQVRDGVILPRPNLALPDLLDPHSLLERLDRMAAGDASAELPSCNTVVRPRVGFRYPIVPSGEDHWYTASLLLEQEQLRVVVAPDLVYAIYHLCGRETRQNLASEAYLSSRRALAAFARERILKERPNGPYRAR